MFKQQRFILRVLLCAVGLTSIFGLDKAWAMSWLGREKIDAPLVKVSFCSGGDMLGSSNGLFVTAVDKEYALITYEDAEHHAQAPVVKEYRVSAVVLDDVKAIFNENGMVSWEKCPRSEMQALDEATTGYSFSFADKRRVGFNSTQDLPEGAYAALRKIRELAQAYCKKGELLPGLITNPVSPAEMNNPREVILGKITLNTYYYRETNLYARLSNGTDSVIKVKDNYALLKEGEPIKLLNDSIGQGERYIHPKYSEEFYIKLAKRLEAGNYTLNIDGYTTNFSIK